MTAEDRMTQAMKTIVLGGVVLLGLLCWSLYTLFS